MAFQYNTKHRAQTLTTSNWLPCSCVHVFNAFDVVYWLPLDLVFIITHSVIKFSVIFTMIEHQNERNRRKKWAAFWTMTDMRICVGRFLLSQMTFSVVFCLWMNILVTIWSNIYVNALNRIHIQTCRLCDIWNFNCDLIVLLAHFVCLLFRFRFILQNIFVW